MDVYGVDRKLAALFHRPSDTLRDHVEGKRALGEILHQKDKGYIIIRAVPVYAFSGDTGAFVYVLRKGAYEAKIILTGDQLSS